MESLLDTTSLIASIASLVISVVAIALSIVFYKFSTAAAEQSRKAADDISSSVERLETIFNKLYSDTFSMMRDTVDDMRRHLWPSSVGDSNIALDDINARIDAKLNDVRAEVSSEIGNVLKQQALADDKIAAIRNGMDTIINRTITDTRHAFAEAQEENIRSGILSAINRSRTPGGIRVRNLMNTLPYEGYLIAEELLTLRSEGIIETSSEDLTPLTRVRLLGPHSSREAF